MHILLVNDDGINAPGLHALAKALGKEHRITVSAPMEERSAVGHGLTVRLPLFAEKREVPGAAAAFAVSGTPADCTRLGRGPRRSACYAGQEVHRRIHPVGRGL